jgi:branched-chain amino acid transport system ATP-binding protein
VSATRYLTVSGVNKRFGGLQALRDCSFSIAAGKIICLVGPNGAGRTITGFMRADDGEVRFKGYRLTGKGPQTIVRLGIARTFQNLRLFADLTAVDNVVSALPGQFGEEPLATTFRPFRTARVQNSMCDKATAILSDVGLRGRMDDFVRNLSYGEQKLLRIARLLATNAELLLLDEPTSGLSGDALESVMALLRRLRDQGRSQLVVEHNTRAVRGAADRRRSSFPPPGPRDGVRRPANNHHRSSARRNLFRRRALMTVLELDALNSGYGAKTLIEAMSFALNPGEILALPGHNGAGKTTTLKAIMGLLPAKGGSVIIEGERIEKLSTAERVHRGLRLLPEGRGIFPQLTVAENVDAVRRKIADASRCSIPPRSIVCFRSWTSGEARLRAS